MVCAINCASFPKRSTLYEQPEQPLGIAKGATPDPSTLHERGSCTGDSTELSRWYAPVAPAGDFTGWLISLVDKQGGCFRLPAAAAAHLPLNPLAF
jgi:hypothetical protein